MPQVHVVLNWYSSLITRYIRFYQNSGAMVMVFNTTFNNSSVISWIKVSFIDRGNQRKPLTCHKSLTNFITQCCIEYTSPWGGSELTTLVAIDTDCIYVVVNPTTYDDGEYICSSTYRWPVTFNSRGYQII